MVTDGSFYPDRAEFTRLAAQYPVVPVTRRVLADGETPIGVYRKLAGGPGTFLLESAEHGRSWSRYSFVGVRSRATLTERDGEAIWLDDPPPGVPLSGNPLEVLHACARLLRAPRLPGMPPLMGGLVGYLGYDFVRRIERLPSLAVEDLHLPELGMMLATELAVLDHDDGSCLLVSNAFPAAAASVDEAYDAAVAHLRDMTAALAEPAPPSVAVIASLQDTPELAFHSRTPAGEYQSAVESALEAIRAGDIFQVTVSQRFEVVTDADPLDVYRLLRTSNPSPYMYLLRLAGTGAESTGAGAATLDIVGSSPESLVTVTGTGEGLVARLHPIAGTRPRGGTEAKDAELAAELVGSEKERAEHIMLVDLGRNDLGRVCEPGTVRVVEFGAVERFSHVMHIVSTVVGEVRADLDAVDVLTACYPAGTLTGAPKVRAMELIDELEPTRRGIYGGGVGYLDFGGDLDLAIAIRTATMRAGVAYAQAGAGIVADSEPDFEEAETRHKARAVLRALALAETLRPAADVPASRVP
ncbi:MAG TPA: anthranilate synthase component I [Frankiaceae bacterium]|nr:anthranilate synthase component I [Frankiaceae bacterium]